MKSPKFALPVLVLSGALLNGCGDGASSVGAGSASAASARISGHVLAEQGPVTQGKVEAKDARGAIAARSELQGQATYVLAIPAGTAYPLVLSVQSDAPSVLLKAAVTDVKASVQDITPVTTSIVDTAMSLGGLSEANLATAATAAIAQRKKFGSGSGGGGSTESFSGDPTKQYGGWH
jgi:glutamate synthase domain-containing protein 2